MNSQQLSLQQLRGATVEMTARLPPQQQATLARAPEQRALQCMLDTSLALCRVVPGGRQSMRLGLGHWALRDPNHTTTRRLDSLDEHVAFLQQNPRMLQVLSQGASCVFAGWADWALVSFELHRDGGVYVRVDVNPQVLATGQLPQVREDFRDTRHHLRPPQFVLTEHARRSSGAVAVGGGAVGGRWRSAPAPAPPAPAPAAPDDV